MRSVSLLLASVVAAMSLACSSGSQPSIDFTEGEVRTWVHDLSAEATIEIIRVTFFDASDTEVFTLDLQRQGTQWSQNVKLPFGTYTARASAIGPDDETLFRSQPTPEFTVEAGQPATVFIFFYQEEIEHGMEAHRFLSVTLDKAPTVGESTTITRSAREGRRR